MKKEHLKMSSAMAAILIQVSFQHMTSKSKWLEITDIIMSL